MGQQHLLLALMVSILVAISAATTAYDILEQNNLPRGLLPQGVKSYVRSPDGKVEVTLPGVCEFFVTLGGSQYKFRYARTIGGIVQSGSIHEAYGAEIQVKFEWIGINQVERAGDQLTIQAQKFRQSFPVNNFNESPRCN
ncbi:hypothetical protein ACP70R_009110 [Stipagrostis hirtigluma subsp. patula]